MRFLLAAILFIVAVAVFTFVIKFAYQGNVEKRLETEALLALQDAGFEGVTVDFEQHNAELGGLVVHEDDKEKARQIVLEAVPVAQLPELRFCKIGIRPTIQPALQISSEENGKIIRIKGTLGEDAEALKVLLGSRLASIAGGSVRNEIKHDPMRLKIANEQSLAAAATKLVRHSESADLVLADGKLTLKGEVANDSIVEGILELASGLEGIEPVNEIVVSESLAVMPTSTLLITRNRFGLNLSGFMAKDGHAEVVAKINDYDPSLTVIDRRELDEGRVPGVWESHIDRILPVLLDHLNGEMTVEFEEKQLRITGIVEAQSNRDAILEAIQPLLDEDSELLFLADVTMDQPEEGALRLATLSGSHQEGLLVIKGVVPDDQFFKSIEEALSADFPDLLVKNDLQIDEEVVAAEWVEGLPTFFVEAMGRTTQGSFHISAADIRLEGVTKEATDKAILQNVAINTVPSGYTVSNHLLHPDQPFPTPTLEPEVHRKLAESLTALPIYFEKNSELLNQLGREKVDAIANLIAESGGGSRLLVTGFADNIGDAAYNRELSLRRANGVVARLVEKGIARENTKTESKEEDVANLPANKRWKARRVEVSLASPPAPSSTTAEATETP